MTLRHFNNETGEGIIGFEQSRTSGPEYDADSSRWYAGVTVNGTRVFQYGCPCGTCGITFKKIASPVDRVSDGESVELLGKLDRVPSESALRRLARILPQGEYYPAVIEAQVRAVAPGTPDDYFATEVVRLFGLEAPEYEKPQDPGTSYYRIGLDHELSAPPAIDGSKALLTQIVMPLQDPTTLDRERVEYWKSWSRAGNPLTAFAVSVLDCQSPAFIGEPNREYQYWGQVLLTHCLLDGHHRLQAACEAHSSARILTLLALAASNVAVDFDFAAVLQTLAAKVLR
jgi:hypothetical protein